MNENNKKLIFEELKSESVYYPSIDTETSVVYLLNSLNEKEQFYVIYEFLRSYMKRIDKEEYQRLKNFVDGFNKK